MLVTYTKAHTTKTVQALINYLIVTCDIEKNDVTDFLSNHRIVYFLNYIHSCLRSISLPILLPLRSPMIPPTIAQGAVPAIAPTGPPTAVFIKLADFYDVSVDYLLNRTEKPMINK